MSAMDDLIKWDTDRYCWQYNETLKSAQAELSQLRGENEAQRRALESADKLIDEHKADNAFLRQERDQARTELGEAINRHNALADSLAEVRGEVEKLKQDYSDLLVDSTEALMGLKSALTQSEKAREGLDGLVKEMAAELELISLSAIQSNQSQCARRLDALLNRKDALLARIEGR